MSATAIRRGTEQAYRTRLIDRFIPDPNVAESHEVTVNAPAGIVMDTAYDLDLQSIPLVRAIFRAREIIMGATPPPLGHSLGLVAMTRSLGEPAFFVPPPREIGVVTHDIHRQETAA